MQQTLCFFVGGLVVDAQLPRRLVDQVAPQPLQEPVHADDVGGVPRPRHVERAHEHLVEAQRVRAVLTPDVVGRDRVLTMRPGGCLMDGGDKQNKQLTNQTAAFLATPACSDRALAHVVAETSQLSGT